MTNKIETAPKPFPKLTPKLFRQIGVALGGRHWQADIAREGLVSKSHVTRFLKPGDDGRIPTQEFAVNLDRIIVDKIEDVANFVGSEGSPLANADYAKAKAKIMEGVAILRRYTPAVPRQPIEETSKRKHKQGRKPKKH